MTLFRHNRGRRSAPASKIRIALGSCCALAAVALAVPAISELTVDRWTMAGGGGESSGGTLKVDGTTAQPDAGVVAGGALVLAGGFWPSYSGAVSGIPSTNGIPIRYAFYPASPNPVQRSTSFVFDLPTETPIRIDVYSVAGTRMRTLIDRRVPAGRLRVEWNASGSDGRRLPAGVYVVVAHAASNRTTQKVVVIS